MADIATESAALVLERIRLIDQNEVQHPDAISLMHAYIACLPVPDLCRTIIATISASASLRIAMRKRLVRLLRERTLRLEDMTHVHDLAEQSRSLGVESPAKRIFVDALLSAIFEHLPSTQQQTILEAWIDRGTRGAAARWLKAVSQVPAMFDETAVLAYYRLSGDVRAAKALANQAGATFLTAVLPELLDRCQEGWIVSRAAMRAGEIDEIIWVAIRSKHPATYLYLCAKLGRSVSPSEATQLVLNCPNSFLDKSRGLAIWAVGQLGLIEVLDEVLAHGKELHRKDLDGLNGIIGSI